MGRALGVVGVMRSDWVREIDACADGVWIANQRQGKEKGGRIRHSKSSNAAFVVCNAEFKYAMQLRDVLFHM